LILSGQYKPLGSPHCRLARAPRNDALRMREIAPDPPGWRTALRFDVDCVCGRRLHAETGYCPRAATDRRETGVAEPSFVVVNPANGHAQCVYLIYSGDSCKSLDCAIVELHRFSVA
jgi:hypothetical protein